MLVDKWHYQLGLRSSSAWAKKAAACLRISFVRLSALFSRSKAASLSSVDCVLEEGLDGWAWDFLTHALSVSGVHPSLSEIDTSAAQREGYSCCCVVTSLIARSRNYNVYRFDFFIVPVSQVIESLANSGRFTFEKQCLLTCNLRLIE